MVTVEIRVQHFDSDHVAWETIARLHADGQQVEMEGDIDRFDLELPVVSLTAGTQIRYEDDPEEWARSLPTVYHAPDFEAVVVADTAPPKTVVVEREHVVVEETTERHAVH